MKADFSANVRHCDSCDRNVYTCHTDEDLALYTSLNYCVAIPATSEDGPMPKNAWPSSRAASRGGRAVKWDLAPRRRVWQDL